MSKSRSMWDDYDALGYVGGHDHGKTGKSGSPWFGGYAGESCYRSHKPLVLGATGLQIYGGSCFDPVVKDADVYIGFADGMRFTSRQYPWNDGIEVLFKVTDTRAPTDAAEFRKLVDWTLAQLQAGKKVHAGCIGGHGRTGTFLSALVKVALDEPDAISYVREHYCKRVVETDEQIGFLVKHFGIKPIKGSKLLLSSGTPLLGAPAKDAVKDAKKPKSPAGFAGTYSPEPHQYSLWGI